MEVTRKIGGEKIGKEEERLGLSSRSIGKEGEMLE